jgi:signal transduction histidine kinase
MLDSPRPAPDDAAMSSPLPAAPHADQPTRRWPLLEAKFWLSLLAVSTGITGFLLLINRLDPWLTFVHTTSITIGCALSIQAGLNLGVRVSGERRPGWPSWPWTVAALLLGTLVGYTLGSLLGNLLTGRSVQTPLSGLSRETLGSLAFALIPGSIIVWYFHTRERLVAAEAQAQAAQRLAAENQLRLLQTQLEPHMLFNTLANLRVLIGLDATRAQAMLDRLIAFLRATLNASRLPHHALSEEFASVDDYLALMSVRMAARLQARLDLPPDLANVPVPPLLLQPLVENAVKHGLEPQVAGGRIEVCATRDGARLRLTVRDTGAGLGAAPVDGTRFGLVQVRERLHALYGSAAGLQIQPADDAAGGTLVTVTLPMP